jgi:hypothetical protein
MSDTAELIGVTDSRWARMLQSTPHDFHHLPAYVALCARFEGGEPRALYADVAGVRALVPLLRRQVPSTDATTTGCTDGASPYGYPAPLFAPTDAPAASVTLCVDRLLAAARDEGMVSLFVRLHPLLDAPDEALKANGQLVAHGQTIYVDLAQPWDAIERGVRSGYRYDVRQLRQRGFRTSIDDWDDLTVFGAVYRETMQRVGAPPQYLFTDEFFVELRDTLQGRLHLATVRAPDGHVAAAGLYPACEGIVQYHLSGTAGQFVRDAPTKLLLMDALRWAHDGGHRRLHLGGGVGGREDSLFNFKAGFSPLRATFQTWRCVLAAQLFDALVAEWRSNASGAAPPTDFFPPYRAPEPHE